MSDTANLHLREDPSKRLSLQPGQPLTIGRASNNRLALVNHDGVSAHHAVVRCTATHGWVVCDWQSSEGTYLEGERIRRCRPLSDGDEIRLGPRGPVLVFSLNGSTAPRPRGPSAPQDTQEQPSTQPQPPGRITINGTHLAPHQIRSAVVLSEPHYPHIFSWWLLTSVSLLLLLPFRIGPLPIFWPLQLAALAAWIVLGSRKRHTLLVVQTDGQAQRHAFANRLTALAHRNGIRKAIGQSLEQP